MRDYTKQIANIQRLILNIHEANKLEKTHPDVSLMLDTAVSIAACYLRYRVAEVTEEQFDFITMFNSTVERLTNKRQHDYTGL